ncbi:hypothetical protein ACP3TB_13330 [Rahnella variigena]
MFYNDMSGKQSRGCGSQGFILSESQPCGLFSPVVTAIVAGHVVSIERGFTYV